MSKYMLSMLAGLSLIATLLTHPSVGQEVHTHHEPRSPRIAVSPVEELTILDPMVDSEKLPETVIVYDEKGQQRIDVPPTIIVHKYYYSGNREFRAPRLPGGPSVVVLNHPDTHQRLYLDVQLLPGSPLIVYRDDYVEYDYGPEQIRIRFEGPLGLGGKREPKIIYKKGKSHLAHRESKKDDCEHEWIQQTGAIDAIHELGQGTKNIVGNSAVFIRKTGEAVITPAKVAINATPFGSMLHDETARQLDQNNRRLQKASNSLEDRWENSITTNR